MRTFGRQAAYVVTHPGAFTLRVLRAFRANQGLLLAGAVAYYTLLSIVPLLILMVIALSQIIDQGELLATLGRYLEWLIPGQSKAVIGELASFLDHRGVIGWVLLVTMVFFSSLAFTVLENATAVMAARPDRRSHRDGALGDHSPRPGLVLRDFVPGQCGLWVTDDLHRRAPEPRDRGDLAVAWGAGYRGVRAYRDKRSGCRATT